MRFKKKLNKINSQMNEMNNILLEVSKIAFWTLIDVPILRPLECLNIEQRGRASFPLKKKTLVSWNSAILLSSLIGSWYHYGVLN